MFISHHKQHCGTRDNEEKGGSDIPSKIVFVLWIMNNIIVYNFFYSNLDYGLILLNIWHFHLLHPCMI